MINIKNNVIDKIKDWNKDNIHIVTDFDRTITVGNSDSSWSILSKSEEVPKEYVSERQELYSYYRPIEIDENMDYDTKNQHMIDWWNKHINLFIKYKMKEEVINNAANNLRVMCFRDGAQEFLKSMHDKGIPVIIISAGIGNFIKQFLIKNNCDFDNIYIVANFIKFEDGVAVGISDNVIHALNKNEVSLPDNIKELLVDRNNIILLGDAISDIKMVSENKKNDALKIGFLEENIDENYKYYDEAFDIVCTNNTGYDELLKEFNKYINKK